MNENKASEITVRVLLFGHYRDIFANGAVELALPANATVADAAQTLASSDARFADLLARTRQAVGADSSRRNPAAKRQRTGLFASDERRIVT